MMFNIISYMFSLLGFNGMRHMRLSKLTSVT